MTTKIETRTGLEVLDRDECIALLERSSLARIAVVIGGQPLVFPVNFTLDGDSVVFRTDEGTKLHAARKGPVAFECDGVDSVYHTGWSVLGTGNTEEVVNAAELARAGAPSARPVVPGPEIDVAANPAPNAHRPAHPAARSRTNRRELTMSLNIMVLESERGAADEAARELTEAGHVVLRCHDADGPAFPCRGIVDQSQCPLRSRSVDVALTVRPRVRSRVAPEEDGARCALMNCVPLVVAGPQVLDPYDGLATRALERTYDVVASCEEAAVAGLSAYERRAEAAIAGTGDPKVRVNRIAGGLRVRVDGLDGTNSRERQAAGARIVGALRTLDRGARTIDVEFRDASA